VRCSRQAKIVNTTRHSNILIVAMPVMKGFKTCFKILRQFSCCVQLSGKCCTSDLDSSICAVEVT